MVILNNNDCLKLCFALSYELVDRFIKMNILMLNKIIDLIKMKPIITLFFFFNSFFGFSQNSKLDSSHFSIYFDDGFNNTIIEIRDSLCKKVLYKEKITSHKVLGFAARFILMKASKYCIIVKNKRYYISPGSFKYIHVNFFNEVVTVLYSSKKKLYE